MPTEPGGFVVNVVPIVVVSGVLVMPALVAGGGLAG